MKNTIQSRANSATPNLNPQGKIRHDKVTQIRQILNGNGTEPQGCRRTFIVDSKIINDMEQAKAQNHALHQLLMDALSGDANDGISYSEEIHAGIVGLIADTHSKMDRIYDALENARQKALQ